MRRLIDFGDADPRDANWWTRLGLALRHVELDGIARLRRMHYDYALALLSRPAPTAEAARQVAAAADAQIAAERAALRPWERAAAPIPVDELAALWDREFGDHRSPEGMAAIAETVRLLQLPAASPRTNHAPPIRR